MERVITKAWQNNKVVFGTLLTVLPHSFPNCIFLQFLNAYPQVSALSVFPLRYFFPMDVPLQKKHREVSQGPFWICF